MVGVCLFGAWLLLGVSIRGRGHGGCGYRDGATVGCVCRGRGYIGVWPHGAGLKSNTFHVNNSIAVLTEP